MNENLRIALIAILTFLIGCNVGVLVNQHTTNRAMELMRTSVDTMTTQGDLISKCLDTLNQIQQDVK